MWKLPSAEVMPVVCARFDGRIPIWREGELPVITHIVLYKLKDRSTESVQRTVQVLTDMEGQIDELESIQVGTNIVHSDRAYDIALTTRFASLDALQAYQDHPVHQKVIEHMSAVREASASVDYES
jgi:hypothetical protein